MYKNVKIALVFLALTNATWLSPVAGTPIGFKKAFKTAYSSCWPARFCTGLLAGYSSISMISGLWQVLATQGRTGISELMLGCCGTAFTTYVQKKITKQKIKFNEGASNPTELTNSYTIGYSSGIGSYLLLALFRNL